VPNIIHSVTLDEKKCKGCTNCIKKCPTQAIRVRNNKATIRADLCIDCGECIRVCPYHAKKAITDSLDIINDFKYKIVLPAPALYGQFGGDVSIDMILNALIRLGFDDIYEVAYAAQIITRKTKELLKSGELEYPVINSACPAVVKLISTKYPDLLVNVLPVISPMNLAAKLARKIATENTGFKENEIGVFFISPCPAKATCTKYPLGLGESLIDGVFSFKDIYKKILNILKDKDESKSLSMAGFNGVCWAKSGGEAVHLELDNYIAVDGIHNVIDVLEEIENDKLKDVQFVEALACTGGCVGGPLTVENNFVAKTRLKTIARSAKGPDSVNEIPDVNPMWEVPVYSRPQTLLDSDMSVAMKKLSRIEELSDELPGLDCGSCGAPSCRALAEDIVRGEAKQTDCIIRFKERIARLTNEMLSAQSEE